MAQKTDSERQAAFIVRAKCDRRLELKSDECSTLWQRMSSVHVLGHYTLAIPAEEEQPEREANLSVYAEPVCLIGRSGDGKTPVDLHAIYVKEKNPLKGVDPIEWMLLTNLEVEDYNQAETVIEWYHARWEIEIFFKVLKGGCQVEYLRLEGESRLFNCLAVYLIVAWRLHSLTMLQRRLPETPCDCVLSEIEWKTIILMKDKCMPPKEPPTLYEITRKLAMLGSFIGRKGDGESGVKSVWLGYQKLNHYIQTVQTVNSLGFNICV